jgi:hypothetical protein
MDDLKGCHSAVLLVIETNAKSVQTQLRTTYYTEQHVSTDLDHHQVRNSYFSKHIEEWTSFSFLSMF